jgi:glycosyltransferase involved in cell wall biosynthesis
MWPLAPLSVFFLASDLSPYGSARQLALVAGGLPRDRFRIEVGTLGSSETPIAEGLRAAGVAVHALSVRNTIDLRGLRILRRTVRTAGPTIVHAWGAAAIRATRFVGSKHSSGGNMPRLVASAASFPAGGLAGWLTARRLRRCDRVVATTWAEGERHHRLGVPSVRLTRISPGVAPPPPPPHRAELLDELGLPVDARFIACAGRLEPDSGFKSAIWALDMVRYDHPDIHLVIFGAGSDRELLEDFARALMFDDPRVHFAGSRADFPAILGHADIAWVTHERGGASLALEAMAAGITVIGWRTADLSEIVEESVTGFLVDFGDRPQLSGKTYPLLKDGAARERLGRAGRRRAAEHFSAARAVEKFARLYEELADAIPAAPVRAE